MSLNMQSKLSLIKDALTSIDGLNVYHYWRPKMNAPYCIWQEEGEPDSFNANNHKQEQVISGTIDYFTKQDLDSMVDSIQNAINGVECLGWSLSNVDYEDETNLIHYTWNFEIV